MIRWKKRQKKKVPPREWVGGRLTAPFDVGEPGASCRPELAVWMEFPDGLVVGQKLIYPEEAKGAVGRALREALVSPLAGPKRCPDTIRVADKTLAKEVRGMVGGSIPIEVAPTPELDAMLQHMAEHFRADDPLPPAEGDDAFSTDIVPFIESASTLYILAPWKRAGEERLLRMDIPAMGIEGACVCIAGEKDGGPGLRIFSSLEDFATFRRNLESLAALETLPLEFEVEWLALLYDRDTRHTARVRRELKDAGVRLAPDNAVPMALHFGTDGRSSPAAHADLALVAACASALTGFCIKHERLIETGDGPPVCESYLDDNDLEVRFTYPYEAHSQFEIEPDPMARWQEASADARHDMDGRLIRKLRAFAEERFGEKWWGHAKIFRDEDLAAQLAVPWSVYQYEMGEETVAGRYLEERGSRLSTAERTWLEAQRAAWLSVWEVIEVEPGVGVVLRDLLSGKTRRVREVSGSETLSVRDAVLGRIIDDGETSLIGGVHLLTLPPRGAAEVVRRVRGWLRLKRDVPVSRLRGNRFCRYVVRRWEDAAEQFSKRPAMPEALANYDGDPILLTTDHFVLPGGNRAGVEKAISALEGARLVESEGSSRVYDFVASGNPRNPALGDTIVGLVRLSKKTLRIDTNSIERADALRARIEASCGARIRHRAREHSDPLSSKAGIGEAPTSLDPIPPEVQRQLDEFKRDYYADWVDQPVPALDGQTPRQAARTAKGRSAVDLLLKDLEHMESRSARGKGRSGFDVSVIRRELGVE